MTGPDRRVAAQDALAVRIVNWSRVIIAAAVAAAGSFIPDGPSAQDAYFVLLGLVYLPWATAVLLSTDVLGRRAISAWIAGDLVALFALQSLVPAAGDGVLMGYVAVAAFATYVSGRMLGVWASLAALTLTVGANQIGVGPEPDAGSDFVMLVAGLVFVLLLVTRTSAERERVVAHSVQVEGRADAILSRVADGVVVTGADGVVSQCNPAGQRLIGRGEEEVVGHHCQVAMGLSSGERTLDCSRGCALLAMGADESHEVWRLDATGRRQPLLAQAAAVREAGGQAVEVVHSLRDITKLKEADEAKTLFLATASHELKTPLTVISGFAETLQMAELEPAEQHEALDAIRKRAGELSRIIDRLLLTSRIEAGRLELSVTDVELSGIVAERAWALQSSTRRIVKTDFSEALPLVSGNAEALITVIDHLLDNALKYSPGGDPVRISATGTDSHVELHISDSGIGMDDDALAHCFDKFWQVESTDVRRFGGTGIGLYIVRSLVEAMGGDVSVTSERGVGTTFTISLRRADAPPPSANVVDLPGVGEATSIREFMRQIGVPRGRA